MRKLTALETFSGKKLHISTRRIHDVSWISVKVWIGKRKSSRQGKASSTAYMKSGTIPMYQVLPSSFPIAMTSNKFTEHPSWNKPLWKSYLALYLDKKNFININNNNINILYERHSLLVTKIVFKSSNSWCTKDRSTISVSTQSGEHALLMSGSWFQTPCWMYSSLKKKKRVVTDCETFTGGLSIGPQEGRKSPQTKQVWAGTLNYIISITSCLSYLIFLGPRFPSIRKGKNTKLFQDTCVK